MIAKLLLYLIITFFVLLWAYVSLPKFFNMKHFSETLKSQAIPKWLAALLTWTLPFVELGVIFLLVMPQTRLLGMYISFGLMFIFTLYVGGIMFQVYDVYPCPCGGIFKRMGWKKHFRVNILITLIALIGILIMEFFL